MGFSNNYGMWYIDVVVTLELSVFGHFANFFFLRLNMHFFAGTFFLMFCIVSSGLQTVTWGPDAAL